MSNRAKRSLFYVVNFIELPFKGIDEYVCVPSSWLIRPRPPDRKVDVTYPNNEDPFDTRDRVIRKERPNDEWRVYVAIIKYESDDFWDADYWIATRNDYEPDEEIRGREGIENGMYLTWQPSETNMSTTASTALSLPPEITPPPATAPAPMLSPTPPTASTSRGPLQRRRHQASPSPVVSPTISTSRTLSTPRRRGLLRVTSDFVAVEHRRLQLEADREQRYHEREMERLRLESRRIEMEEKQNQILSRLVLSVNNLIEILPQLRPSSLPSTDMIP